MKRAEFLRNLTALAIGLGPQIAKADKPIILSAEELRPFNGVGGPHVISSQTYEDTKKNLDLYLAPDDKIVLTPDRVEMGTYDLHTLVFNYEPYVYLGSALTDEQGRTYMVMAISRAAFPEIRVCIREFNRSRRMKGRSRRRGLMPRIGKQYTLRYQSVPARSKKP